MYLIVYFIISRLCKVPKMILIYQALQMNLLKNSVTDLSLLKYAQSTEKKWAT